MCPRFSFIIALTEINKIMTLGYGEIRTYSTLSSASPLWFLKLPLKALANKDTLLWTHCYRHKCFLVCPCTQHLRTQILCPGHKKCFWFYSETFCVHNKFVSTDRETSWATMCPQQCALVCQGLNCSNEDRFDPIWNYPYYLAVWAYGMFAFRLTTFFEIAV